MYLIHTYHTMGLESLDLNTQTLELFIEWVSHHYPSLAPEYVEKAQTIIASGETTTFKNVVESTSPVHENPVVIDEDTKMTSENYAVVLDYLGNIYGGEKFAIMKEVVEQQIVKDGKYFEVRYLNAISTDILRERTKKRDAEEMRTIKPFNMEDKRALFAKAALSRIKP